MSSLQSDNESDNYIVSLTTFSKRINYVWLTIESLLRQTTKPESIILWLSETEFSKKSLLPDNLLKLEKRGLQIRICESDIKPHEKYFHAIREFPKANIITVDDDMIYSPDLVESLKKCHHKYPRSICCTIGRIISVNEQEIKSYREWDVIDENTKPSFKYLPIGAGGVLYPSGFLHPEVSNFSALKELAPLADDLWLKIMSIKKRTKVVCLAGEYPRNPIPLIIKNNEQLMKKNLIDGQNDKIIRDILNHYQMKDSFVDKF